MSFNHKLPEPALARAAAPGRFATNSAARRDSFATGHRHERGIANEKKGMTMLRPTLVLMSLTALAATAAEAQVPNLELAPPGLLERHCDGAALPAADADRAERVRAGMAEFRAAWEADGPELLQATLAVTGRPFGFAEAVATLHACDGLGSLSAPLLIDAGRYFEDASFDRRERRHFAYTVWHELMHRQIALLLGRGAERESALLRRHAGEAPVTLNHLHLLALEHMVYRHLGREEEFHARGRAYGARGNHAYARAYEIVVAEGAEAFVAELRAGPAT